MAAGLTVARDQLEPAMARLSDLLAARAPGRRARAICDLDGVLMPGAATADLVDSIEAAGPFGAGAPAPRLPFLIKASASPSAWAKAI